MKLRHPRVGSQPLHILLHNARGICGKGYDFLPAHMVWGAPLCDVIED